MMPRNVDAHNNLGVILRNNGRLDEAVAVYRHAISLNPNLPIAYINLGIALTDKGQLDEAIGVCRRAIALNPILPQAHINLGNALSGIGRLDEAIDAVRRAISLQPNYPEAYSNLGEILRENGQIDDAIAAGRQAVALNPKLAGAYDNVGNALRDKGEFEQAAAAFRQAISLDPNLPESHHNLGMLLLLQGNFLPGWKEFEWRRQCRNVSSPRWNFTQPQWDGSDLTNRTIFLYPEQGFGDSIHFIRYVRLIAERGGKAIVACLPELPPLFKNMSGVEKWVTSGESVPSFDFHCPLMSLPLAFGTTFQDIPRSVPYLQVDAQAIELWRRKLAGERGFKVGLVWAGSPIPRNRSMDLATLAPLAQVQGVSFYSLQKGAAAEQTKAAPHGLNLIDRTEELSDFVDTAALISNLDLVISVDTAVAHLAGAMGKPVWTLLSFVSDWAWLLHRQDTPWYPTMRLFRQPAFRDWKSVIDQVIQALTVTARSS